LVGHLVEVMVGENFRQGDIIKREESQQEKEWGVILNADCDIEQKKNFGALSWMEVIRVESFLDQFWVRNCLDKIFEKQCPLICQEIDAVIKKSNKDLSPLTKEDIVFWLDSVGPNGLIRDLGYENQGFFSKLEGLDAIVKYDGKGGVSVLKNVYKAFGLSVKNIKNDAISYLNKNSGFSDFFFVPGLPGEKLSGFVILLRHIRGGYGGVVYKSEVEAKISGDESGYFRIGRFNDNLRFQIVQKMAFLFSRIGSPVSFEQECDVFSRSTIEEIFE